MPKNKKNEVLVELDIEKFEPNPGDLFVVTVNSDDPNIIGSNEIRKAVENLGDTILENRGFRVPIVVTGDILSFQLLSKAMLRDFIETLSEIEKNLPDDEDDDFDYDYDDEDDDLDDIITDKFK